VWVLGGGVHYRGRLGYTGRARLRGNGGVVGRGHPPVFLANQLLTI